MSSCSNWSEYSGMVCIKKLLLRDPYYLHLQTLVCVNTGNTNTNY